MILITKRYTAHVSRRNDAIPQRTATFDVRMRQFHRNVLKFGNDG